MDHADPNERRASPVDDDLEQRRDPGLDIEGSWQVAQSRFLEAPREAVAAADELVGEAVEDVHRRLDDERAQVAELWRRDGADTEDLRTAMLRYREVLDRLATRIA